MTAHQNGRMCAHSSLLPLPASEWTLKFSSAYWVFGGELGMCQLGNYFNDFVSKLNSGGQKKGENTRRMNKNVDFGSENVNNILIIHSVDTVP